jgi:CelD/BcsL family acetyltransferase involved in cellulose biosynthesis
MNLRGEWEELSSNSGEISPFLSYSWVMTWLEFCGTPRSMRVIVVRQNGKVVGIAPLCLNTVFGFRVIEFLGFKQVDGEMGAFLIAPGLEPVIAPVLIQTLTDFPDSWDALSFYGVRSGSRFEHQLSNYSYWLLKKTLYFRSLIGPARIIRLNGDWESFIGRSSRRFRATIRSDRARCAKAGFSFIAESTLAHHADVVSRLIAVESRSWQGHKGHPVIRDNKEFFDRLFAAWIASNEVEIFWARNDSGYHAFLVCLIVGSYALFYRTGYDVDMAHLSLGANLFYVASQSLSQRGIQVVDMMTDIGGHTSYKDHWTKEFEMSMRHLFLRKSKRGRLIGLAFCAGLKQF